ncbi:MAG: hypothetical protein HY397_03620 [Candidatus Doudnabacteria bacterium]|nr:hypothetical protein [Candidatus Doudnabacteria bacterium]
MVTKEALETLVVDSGLWAGERRLTHKFVLSPEVFEISNLQVAHLQQLGVAVRDCLSGLGRIAAIAFDPKLTHGSCWGMIRRALNTGVPEGYRQIQTLHPGRGPAICKVDMIACLGFGGWGIDTIALPVVEVDGHNKHGLGYSTLAAQMRDVIAPQAKTLPGVAKMLAKLIRNKNEGGNQAGLVYADQERFYLPEFLILRKALEQLGIELVVAGEKELVVRNGLPQTKDGKPLPPLLVDFPFLYWSPELNAALAAKYREEHIDFLIPPKPFMGSKAALAILCNSEQDARLEAILRSQIPQESLERLRFYVPKTFLASKGTAYLKKIMEELGGLTNRLIIKPAVSCGMKKTAMSGDPHFSTILKQAAGSYYHYVLQEEVEPDALLFQYFDDDGQMREGAWYLRITAHFCVGELADIVVTARRDKHVHGAKDCLQLGTIIKPEPS